MTELEPCPFCSGKAYIEAWEMAPFEKAHIGEGNDGHFYAAVCSECGASSGSQLSEEEAAAAWNRRAGEDGN